MPYPSASSLYRQAAGLAPDVSATVSEDSHCVMCAAPLLRGDLANPLTRKTFDSGFNNTLDLRALTGKYVCGDCKVLWSKDWMQKYSKSFACEAGVFKLASNIHRAGFFLNPPEPPFAAIFSNRQQQHMIWRTPLTLSRDFIIVRVDDDLLTIRRPVLMEGYRAFKHAEGVMATVKLEGRKTYLKPPAAIMTQKLAGQQMGTLRLDVEELLRQVGDTWAVDILNSLSMGEWWALNSIRGLDPENPPAHEPAMEPG